MNITRFRIADVAEIIGVKVATIRSWYQRRQMTVGLSGGVDLDPESDGMARYVSAHTAVALGLFSKLTSVGVPAATAAKLAMEFAHVGDDRREKCHLFPSGETHLVYSASGGYIINVLDGEKPADKLPPQDRYLPMTSWAVDEFVPWIRDELDLGRYPSDVK